MIVNEPVAKKVKHAVLQAFAMVKNDTMGHNLYLFQVYINANV